MQASAMANLATLMEAGRCGSDCARIALAAAEADAASNGEATGLEASAARATRATPSREQATAAAVAWWRRRAAISGSGYSGANFG
jgi:hypothetical protein